MIYTISIDWLALHCHYCPVPDDPFKEPQDTDPRIAIHRWEPKDTPDQRDLFTNSGFIFRYKKAQYATRQFSELWLVAIKNEVAGWDDFAEVQCCPYSGILSQKSVIVRWVNRQLYTPDFWERAWNFLERNDFVIQGISRIDICADFNQFLTMSPMDLIQGFAAKKFRHMGQGVGAMYFNHGHGAEVDERGFKINDYGVRYTGLSFGTHSSDFRVYLYDKSFELMTQGEKPWIRDRWKEVGLDGRHVWRLEVSIKSKGMKFRDANTGKDIHITESVISHEDELSKMYHTFVAKKFDFRINDKKQTNVSRLERIRLFDNHPIYAHRTIRNVSPGNRFERMFLKALYQLGDLYRGQDMKDDALLAQSLSYDIAHATDLTGWMSDKIQEWEKPTHK